MGGVSHLHFACSPRRERSEKGEGVSHPNVHVDRAQEGGIPEIVLRYRTIRGH